MNRRPLDVNAASMVGLKAELYKKREEARRAAAGGGAKDPGRKSAKKTPLWARQNRGVDARAAKDRPEAPDSSADLLERSRQALEAKARLYDELSRSKLPVCAADDDSGFLVDFERKAEEKAEEKSDEEWDEREEDWVEYEDAFGRLRRCLREELPHHLARNDELRERLSKKEEKKDDEEEEDGEEEEEEERSEEAAMKEEEEAAPSKLELHYADVQQAEIRQHGVGFYALSSEAGARQQQMAQLQRLREETDKSRQRAARIREKRKAALEERLARVKQRRAAAEGKEVEKDEEKEEEPKEEPQGAQNEAAIASKLSELRAQAELLKPRPAAARREWDRGKAMLSAEKYLEMRRGERSGKFAPPSNYFK